MNVNIMNSSFFILLERIADDFTEFVVPKWKRGKVSFAI